MSQLLTKLYNTNVATQRATAVVFGLLFVAILIGTPMLGILKVSADQDSLIEKRELLGQLIQTTKLNPKSVQPNDPNETSLFFIGENEEIIKAELQSKISRLAASNGLKITSISGQKTESQNGLNLIGIRVELSGGLEAIHKTLFAIETSAPPLMTKSAVIRSANRGLQRISTAPTQISLELNLQGILAPNIIEIESVK